jgi:cytosine/adenosine deaminase-related metal-dependent hydrolase
VKESPIFAKTHDLLLWLIPRTLKFPREYRFSLVQHLQAAAFDLQDHLLAAATDKSRQHEHLIAADVSLNQLRQRLRLSHALNLFTDGQYRHASEMTSEIGRLLGAWLHQQST